MATQHICSKIYNLVFPLYRYLCHMERDGGRSTGVFLAASEVQPHSNEKNKPSLQNPLRNCHHLVPCILRGTRRSTRLRNLLTNTLMRSCPVEAGHIVIEHTLELLLMQDQQVIKTFLSHTSGRSVRRSHSLGEHDMAF
jgi:hypothetical protein